MRQDAQGAREEVPLPPAPAAAALLAAHKHCGEEDALGAPSTPSPCRPHTAASPGEHGRRPPPNQHPGSEGTSSPTPRAPRPPGDSELLAPQLGLVCTVTSFHFFLSEAIVTLTVSGFRAPSSI